MKKLGILFIYIIALLSVTNSARILGVFQMPSHSHQSVFQPIWKELSLRGHNVTVITSHPLKDPSLVNLTEIDMSYTIPLMQKHGFQFFMSKENYIFTKIQKIFNLNFEIAEEFFKNKEFIDIYNNSNVKYDLIIAQTYVSPIMYSLTAKLGAPIIGIASMGGWVGTHLAMGNPNPPSLYSEMFLHYNGKLSLYERMCSLLYNIWTYFYLNFDAIPKSDAIARKYLGNTLPYLGEIEKNLSLLFLTTNPILYTPRPTVPTIISLEQMHLKPPKPLPKELKTLLDNAKGSIVYFSLGSNVQSVNMPERLKKILTAAFSELPYTILWKWESEVLPDKPDNVIIRKWFPQQDILVHPKVKLFVSQCGLQSIEEAVSAGVPMVGIPFIADQTMNTKRLVEVGAAIGLEYLTVTKEQVKEAIIEVAENKRYKENILKLHKLWTDHPMPALDRAMWWIEYVIRHKGTKHLRSPTVDISWTDYFLFDVIFVFILCCLILLYILGKFVLLLKHIFFSNKKQKKL